MKALYKFEAITVFQAAQKVGGFIILTWFSLLTEKSSKNMLWFYLHLLSFPKIK